MDTREGVEIPCPQATTTEAGRRGLPSFMKPGRTCSIAVLAGMSGLELSHALAAVRDATPVVFITAHDDPEVRAEAEASGCVGYFRKTDPGQSVLEAITKAAGKQRTGPC